ncbi:hypothetical protein [Paenibacillus hamazuiensis]|uniref:hypothetical protein n=1 Tax=Paenibacillus hamazuiensis TaxID=2936508 RepID=UPI00200DC31B|nr:hypothetical protein [Paenibacillus hamazuiensis]
MAEEVYRIEIPVSVEDHSEPGLSNAEKKVSRFDQTVDRTRKRLERMNQTRWQLVLHTLDRASGVIQRVGAEARRVASGSYRLTVRVMDLATRPLRAIGRLSVSTAGLLTSGLAAVGAYKAASTSIGGAAELELQAMQLEALVGNAEKAQKLFQQMNQLGMKSTFSERDFLEGAKTFLPLTKDLDQINQLVRLQERLAASNPYEGMQGAAFSIREALSGDMVSLQERFNVPRSMLANLKNATDMTGRIKALDNILNQMGYTQAYLTKVNGSAAAQWDNLKSNMEMALKRAGSQALERLKPVLQQLNDFFSSERAKRMIAAWGKALDWGVQQAIWFGRRVGDLFDRTMDHVRRKYLDNPEFQRLDFAGKIRFIFDDIQSLFADWWQSKGKAQVEKISGQIGGAIGGTIGGFIMTALGAADPRGVQVSESPFIQAGSTAGRAFLESFLEAFDAKRIAQKAAEAFKNLQPTWLGGETSSGAGQALALAMDAWLVTKAVNLLKGPYSVGKGLIDFSKWAFKRGRGMRRVGGGAAVATAADATASVAAATTARHTASAAAETAGRLPWYRRLLERLPSVTTATAAEGIPMATAGPSAQFSRGYRPAGKQFWKNIPMDHTYRRDDIVRMANAGELQRYNELEKTFGRAIAPKASWWQRLLPTGGSGRGLGLLARGAGKLALPLSIGMDALSIVAAKPGQERNRAIGGAAGGWAGFAAGAAGGAAIGSVIPGLGTAVGGLIGGILGSIGGGAIGDWIGSKGEDISRWFDSTLWPSLKDGARTTWTWISDTGPQAIAKGVGYAVGYIGSTLFSGEWWNEKWASVEAWALNAWERTKGTWNNTVAAIESTIFNGKWWQEKWQGVQDWAKNTWEGAQQIWSDTREAISSTLFDGKWWQEKWKGVEDWASTAWESIKGKWGSFWGKISGAFQEGREAGQQAAGGPKAYARGGMITRPHVGLVGEAGPEVIIPLSAAMRGRGLELWQQAGQWLGATPYGQGGFVGGPPIRLNSPSLGSVGALDMRPSVNVGGIRLGDVNVTFELKSDDQNVMETIRRNGQEIADDLAGIIKRGLEDSWANGV